MHTKIEKVWQQKWAEAGIFNSEPSKKKKLFITTPYPYISGSLHIGHARAVIEVDVFSRFKRMSGFNVLYPMAFHISGTPVLGISLAIKNKDEKKINLYRGYVSAYVDDSKEIDRIVDSFEDPLNIIDFFIPKMKEEYSLLGLGVDWRRSFTSGDILHQRLVEWQFRQYEKKGYLTKGKYPVLFSLSLNSAAGEDDISNGDTDPVEKKEFTLLKFGFEKGFIVAATLRPETMYGQTNMWVNPSEEYVKAKVDGEIWYISKECSEKLDYQDKEIKVIENIRGDYFINKDCIAPFIDRPIPIYESAHCDGDIGTGFVTSVPSDAPFDYIALKELQDKGKAKEITLIPIIDTEGYGELPAKRVCEKLGITALSQRELLEKATQEIYKAGFHLGIMRDGKYKGMSVVKARDEMKKAVLSEGKADIMWEVSRKAVSRDGGKIIVAILDGQWFIDFNSKGWKEKAQNCLDDMQIVPEKYRKQFEDVFAWLERRPCARRKGLGTPLPFDPAWMIESLSDSTMYMTLYTIAHKIRDQSRLNDMFFDYVFNGEGSVKEVSKETEMGIDEIEDIKKSFDYWYPLDHRHTFNAHLPNHLSFMIFAHAATLRKKHFPKKISFHGMILSAGTKMSKSKGNVITLKNAVRVYGADAFRAFLCYSTSVESDFNWEDMEAKNMKSHIQNLYKTISTADITDTTDKKNEWFLSKFEHYVESARNAIEEMNLREYARIILFDIYHAYRKLQNTGGSINSKVLDKWILMLSPLTPHIAEDLWNGDGFACTQDFPCADRSQFNDIAEARLDLLSTATEDIKKIIELTKIKPKKIKLIMAAQWKYNFFRMFKDLIEKTRDQKVLISQIMQTGMKSHGQEIMKIVPAILKDTSKIPIIVLDRETESEAIDKVYLKRIFEAEIVVELYEDSNDKKANAAIPGKPAIVIE